MIAEEKRDTFNGGHEWQCDLKAVCMQKPMTWVYTWTVKCLNNIKRQTQHKSVQQFYTDPSEVLDSH